MNFLFSFTSVRNLYTLHSDTGKFYMKKLANFVQKRLKSEKAASVSSNLFTGHLTGITHLQRVGVGLIFTSMSMVTAAIMEVKRKSVARDHNMLDALPVLQPLPITVFWLSFQYFIFGIADMFT